MTSATDAFMYDNVVESIDATDVRTGLLTQLSILSSCQLTYEAIDCEERGCVRSSCLKPA